MGGGGEGKGASHCFTPKITTLLRIDIHAVFQFVGLVVTDSCMINVVLTLQNCAFCPLNFTVCT